MSIQSLLEQIDAQLACLQTARSVLINGSVSKTTLRKKGVISPEGRDNIAAAQKKRWAAQRRLAK